MSLKAGRQTLLVNVIIFTRALRAAGVAVRPGATYDAVRALDDIGFGSRSDVRDALRTVLTFRRDDFDAFDRLFDRFWRVWPEGVGPRPRPMQVPARTRLSLSGLAPALAFGDRAGAVQPQTERVMPTGTYSPDEAWRRKDFASFTPEDLDRATAALATLAWDPGVRVTRRWVAGSGPTIDLRRLLGRSARRGGELMAIPYRIRRVAPRPLVIICDVSGSMEPYARMMLLFAHAMAGARRRVEIFVFSTRLTRVTREFRRARVAAAVSRVRDAVLDWSGGTRIGEAIHTFNREWARRVLSRGPVVLIISDGWDLGNPELLASEVARLQRSAFRLVWLNPLLGSPGYEPLARGMRAALPFVDDFLPVHNMASLETLAGELNALAATRARREARRRGADRATTTWN